MDHEDLGGDDESTGTTGFVIRHDRVAGKLAATRRHLIDALFNEEMAEDTFMTYPTLSNYENLRWARLCVENLKGPCQQTACGHPGELHDVACLVEGCACQEYAPADPPPKPDHDPELVYDDAALVVA